MNPTRPTTDTGPENAAAPPPPVGALTDGALCLWFALVIVTFWGPYLGFLVPAITTPLYGAFLLGGATAAALRLLRAREATRAASTAEGSVRRGG